MYMCKFGQNPSIQEMPTKSIMPMPPRSTPPRPKKKTKKTTKQFMVIFLQSNCKLHGIKFGGHNITLLYPNLCYSEVC